MYDHTDELPADRILLVGHGLLGVLGPAAHRAGLVHWAGDRQVRLYQLPRPAFAANSDAGQRTHRPPTRTAERLAELDDLESVFEDIAGHLASGGRVIGLAVPGSIVASGSGRAWLQRVRAIAGSIAGLSELEVWTVTAGQATLYEPTAPIRVAS